MFTSRSRNASKRARNADHISVMENKTNQKLDRVHKEIADLKTAELSFSNNCISVLEVDSKNYEDFVEPDCELRSFLRYKLEHLRCPPRTLTACRP